MLKPCLKLHALIRAALFPLLLAALVNAVALKVFAGERTVFFKYQDPIVITKGKTLYKDQCASCHGDNLEGQENWRQRWERIDGGFNW